jgi:hypothetical protein
VISHQKHYFDKYHSDSTHKHSEVQIKKMLEFFIDNIYIVVSSGLPTVCWNSNGYELCSVVSGSVLCSYEAEFIQKLLHEKYKSLAVAFNSTFRYIDNVLSINNNHFHSYVDSIYPNELEIKDTTECSTFAS